MIFQTVLFFCVLQYAHCSQLPAWCYDPPGNDCSWYKDCLVRQYPCEASNDSYAINFGDRICNEFTSQRPDFSETGQHWIDTTKACLQKQLTPVLSASPPMSCPEIQAFAFSTHAHCYSDPPVGSPSFCELPFSDWLRITWIVKSSFLIETTKTSSQVLQILGKCTSNLFG